MTISFYLLYFCLVQPYLLNNPDLSSHQVFVFFLSETQSSLTRMALHALSRMETRKYHSGSSDSLSTREENGNTSDTESTLSVHSEGRNSKCVICLEKFKEGQVIASFFLPTGLITVKQVFSWNCLSL